MAGWRSSRSTANCVPPIAAGNAWRVPAGTAVGAARLALWADQRDKYVLRLELGNIQRWVICERLPALLHAAGSVNALVQLGRADPLL